MLMKTAGISMILGGTTLTGMLYSLLLKERITLLEEYARLLLLLEGEIRCHVGTLAEALEQIGTCLEEPFAWAVGEIARDLRKMDGRELAVIWREGMRRALEGKGSGLKGEQLERIYSLGKGLGHLDRKMQLDQLALGRQEVQIMVETARGEFGRNGRLFQAMGIMAGILIVILIL